MLMRIFMIITALFCIVSSMYFHKLQAQEIKIEAKKIDYILPYGGILPDNPLYFLKASRDHILQFLTRDNYKKVQLYLLLSDKRASMAIELAKNGKWQLATSTLSKGEVYMSYIPDTVKTLKKQGATPPQDFILTAKLASEKHQEVIETLLKDAPQEQRISLENSLKMNLKTRGELNTL